MGRLVFSAVVALGVLSETAHAIMGPADNMDLWSCSVINATGADASFHGWTAGYVANHNLFSPGFDSVRFSNTVADVCRSHPQMTVGEAEAETLHLFGVN